MNRLDRETSGLVLVAKTAIAARDFGLLMQRHSLRKEYLAIVWGWPEWEHKLIDATLDRQSKHQHSVIWLKQMIHVAGAPAQTEFFVERRFRRSTAAADRFSVIRAIPRTGALIKFGFISPQSDTRLWVIKSTAPTSSCTCVSSKLDGLMSSVRNFCCHDMLCTRRNWPSRTTENGPAGSLLILPNSVAAVSDRASKERRSPVRRWAT